MRVLVVDFAWLWYHGPQAPYEIAMICWKFPLPYFSVANLEYGPTVVFAYEQDPRTTATHTVALLLDTVATSLTSCSSGVRPQWAMRAGKTTRNNRFMSPKHNTTSLPLSPRDPWKWYQYQTMVDGSCQLSRSLTGCCCKISGGCVSVTIGKKTIRYISNFELAQGVTFNCYLTCIHWYFNEAREHVINN